ncbi:NifB/NifX family molybdenum-iron cluster-binding protein [Fervidobacterium riparium]|uniref:Predicted Fe-Mo cluster-binding protein, NifX family n=1 Tax=Fervidobacterium gondwanense DSM 13020 TaxID=1121883 RepID=A0A1M7T6U9_FERGO|nr:NifB/NifX family molybdenum-iron cluster-binding protein [Fervidobacterium gondwanense]UXF01816.1 dinitrogenase iron-molybdenum cofactor biosynthesis protein [Fervidobacterium riparium]SHN66415.1 Predicted Fe-Mo cluster-binding protein, NifX family [Fervidobacterium gondwanense DSM 13020]
MRFAIPTNDSKMVADHFGRAEYFTIVEIKDGKEFERKLVENLHAKGHHGHHGHHGHEETHETSCCNGHGNGHGNGNHHHGHDDVFESTGQIDAVVAVRMGQHMYEELVERKIDIYLVEPGTSIDTIVSKMISGELKKIEPRK